MVCIAFFAGGGIGFFLAALLATAAHDDECARCWSRFMRREQPKDYEP
jgi:hypothetical protein